MTSPDCGQSPGPDTFPGTFHIRSDFIITDITPVLAKHFTLNLTFHIEALKKLLNLFTDFLLAMDTSVRLSFGTLALCY